MTSALAFAFAAGIYPVGLAIVVRYLGEPASMRLAFAYFGGAATATLGSGTVILVALRGFGLTERQHPTPSAGMQMFLGAALLLVAAWVARRRVLAGMGRSGRSEATKSPREEERRDGVGGHTAEVAAAGRHTSGAGGLFLLGLVTYLPSILYVGAIKNLVDADLGDGLTVLALFVCAVLVLQMVELPIILRLLVPRRTGAILASYNTWMHRHGWKLVILLAAAGGVYFLAHGIMTLLATDQV